MLLASLIAILGLLAHSSSPKRPLKIRALASSDASPQKNILDLPYEITLKGDATIGFTTQLIFGQTIPQTI